MSDDTVKRRRELCRTPCALCELALNWNQVLQGIRALRDRRDALERDNTRLHAERDRANAKADAYLRDWCDAKSEFITAAAALRRRIVELEVERTRYRARVTELERQLANVEAFGEAPCGCERHADLGDLWACDEHGRHRAWNAARAVQLFLEWCGGVER